MQKQKQKKFPRKLAMLLALGALGGCGGGQALRVAEAPPVASGPYASLQYSPESVAFFEGLVYSQRPNAGMTQYVSANTKAQDVRQSVLNLNLDVWVPPNASATRPQPLVVWIHGGAFSAGSKENVRKPAITYAQAGYVTAAVNYRLTPNNLASRETRVLAQMQAAEDVANAIRYLKANASRFHIDTTRVVTIGTSAGGGLSMINAVDADTVAGAVSDYPGVSAKVQAAVSSGATLIDVYDTVSELTFDATDTPIQLMHANPTDASTGATWTGNVLPTQTLIQNSGNTCEVVAQPDMTHTVPLPVGGAYWGYMYPFIRSHLNLAALGAP